jgi:hypothetical protein
MATKKPKTKIVLPSNNPESGLREFKKTNKAIGLTVVEGNFSLLARKLFNVMMWQAQVLKQLGENAPINTPSAKKYFWVPLSSLVKDTAYNSNDTQALKDVLLSMQDIKIEKQTEVQWTGERLISSITFANPEGLNKHSGTVWVGYAFPPEVHEHVMVPDTYTKMSLVYQNAFKTNPGLALYEVCIRYATNPSKVTNILTIKEWHGVLTGNPPDDREIEYKYFKRDVVTPSMNEVNGKSNIVVELIEHKKGRRVDRLQFKIVSIKPTNLDAPLQFLFDAGLLHLVVELGFTEAEAKDFVADHGAEKIRQAVELVKVRASNTKLQPLVSIAAYFRWQLREMPKQDDPVGSAAQPKLPPNTTESTAMEKYKKHLAEEALAIYNELNTSDQETIFAHFVKDNLGKSFKLDKGLKSPMVRSLFSNWHAVQLWGPATESGLMEYLKKTPRTS